MIRIDGVRHKLDAIDPNAALFMTRELEAVEAEIYRFKERELLYRRLIPVSNRDNPGAETITYRMYGAVGMAKVITDYSQDLPRADVYGTSVSQPVRSLGIAVGYNHQEIRAAMMAGVSLETEKAAAQRRGVHEKEHRLAFNGDAATGINGFLDNANIPTLAAGNGAGGTPDWASKTPDEIIADIRIACSTVPQPEQGRAQAGYRAVAQCPVRSDRRHPAQCEQRYDHFGVHPERKDLLRDLHGRAHVHRTGQCVCFRTCKDGMVVYEKNRENFELRIPMELTVYPMQERGLEMIVPGESRIGGVVVRYPLAFLFFTGI